jgi:hypothetical protein
MSTVIAGLYQRASGVAREAAARRKTIEQVVVERNMMSEEAAANRRSVVGKFGGGSGVVARDWSFVVLSHVGLAWGRNYVL